MTVMPADCKRASIFSFPWIPAFAGMTDFRSGFDESWILFRRSCPFHNYAIPFYCISVLIILRMQGNQQHEIANVNAGPISQTAVSISWHDRPAFLLLVQDHG